MFLMYDINFKCIRQGAWRLQIHCWCKALYATVSDGVLHPSNADPMQPIDNLEGIGTPAVLERHNLTSASLTHDGS